jgi:hypothetical protein
MTPQSQSQQSVTLDSLPPAQGRSVRPIRIEGDIAYITLTKGYVAVIDAADVPLVEGFNWCAMVRSHTVYAVRGECSGQKQRLVRMHRALMGDPEGLEVDHIDGDGLNNRRHGTTCNLRIATRSQNGCNCGIRSNNSSGFKGVSWSAPTAKWRAEIRLHGKSRHLGYHDTPEAAHAAYVQASARMHGDFGRAK